MLELVARWWAIFDEFEIQFDLIDFVLDRDWKYVVSFDVVCAAFADFELGTGYGQNAKLLWKGR